MCIGPDETHQGWPTSASLEHATTRGGFVGPRKAQNDELRGYHVSQGYQEANDKVSKYCDADHNEDSMNKYKHKKKTLRFTRLSRRTTICIHGSEKFTINGRIYIL